MIEYDITSDPRIDSTFNSLCSRVNVVISFGGEVKIPAISFRSLPRVSPPLFRKESDKVVTGSTNADSSVRNLNDRFVRCCVEELLALVDKVATVESVSCNCRKSGETGSAESGFTASRVLSRLSAS